MSLLSDIIFCSTVPVVILPPCQAILHQTPFISMRLCDYWCILIFVGHDNCSHIIHKCLSCFFILKHFSQFNVDTLATATVTNSVLFQWNWWLHIFSNGSHFHTAKQTKSVTHSKRVTNIHTEYVQEGGILCGLYVSRLSHVLRSAVRLSSSGSSSTTCVTGSWCGASHTRGTGRWPTSTLTCSARRTPGPRWAPVVQDRDWNIFWLIYQKC